MKEQENEQSKDIVKIIVSEPKKEEQRQDITKQSKEIAQTIDLDLDFELADDSEAKEKRQSEAVGFKSKNVNINPAIDMTKIAEQDKKKELLQPIIKESSEPIATQ